MIVFKTLPQASLDSTKAREIAQALLASGKEIAIEAEGAFSQWASISHEDTVNGEQFRYIRVLQRFYSDDNDDVRIAQALYRVRDNSLEEVEL